MSTFDILQACQRTFLAKHAPSAAQVQAVFDDCFPRGSLTITVDLSALPADEQTRNQTLATTLHELADNLPDVLRTRGETPLYEFGGDVEIGKVERL
jgi:hypothetical protein